MRAAQIETPTEGQPVETIPVVIEELVPTYDSASSGQLVNVPAAATGVALPTQVRRPWRSTARTFVQAFVPTVFALGFIVPEVVKVILDETGDVMPPRLRVALLAISAGISTFAAIVARIMAIPKVEKLLRAFPLTRGWLSAAPPPTS